MSNRFAKRRLASLARKGLQPIPDDEPVKVGPDALFWRLGGVLFRLAHDFFPTRTIGQLMLVNFAAGAAVGIVIVGGAVLLLFLIYR